MMNPDRSPFYLNVAQAKAAIATCLLSEEPWNYRSIRLRLRSISTKRTIALSEKVFDQAIESLVRQGFAERVLIRSGKSGRPAKAWRFLGTPQAEAIGASLRSEWEEFLLNLSSP